jgi:hypothetical protein
MTTTLRMLPDYGTESIYNIDDDDYLEAAELPLSSETQKALAGWEAAYDDAAMNRRDLTAIHEQGRNLAETIQAELGSDYRVFYGSNG